MKLGTLFLSLAFALTVKSELITRGSSPLTPTSTGKGKSGNSQSTASSSSTTPSPNPSTYRTCPPPSLFTFKKAPSN
ncbi:hypothetical protein BKA61DRAFT_587042 [Leptodontidium sp. MPI-SDFR-AT-0119]|nr:hypothetical protein BKA61DRAFT_587042 [Leptodontidium sp. MPI-SDFR-AT-0119]